MMSKVPATTSRGKKIKKRAERAQRFGVEIPIRYRAKGEAGWQRGTTVNVSASGILFRARQVWRPKTVLEVMLTLPVAISGEAPAEIGCRGAVIRSVAPAAESKPALVAISIVRYRFLHKPVARTVSA